MEQLMKFNFNFKNYLIYLEKVIAKETYKEFNKKMFYEFMDQDDREKLIEDLTNQLLQRFKVNCSQRGKEATQDLKVCEKVIRVSLHEVFEELFIAKKFNIIPPINLCMNDEENSEYFSIDNFYNDVENWIRDILLANWELFYEIIEHKFYASFATYFINDKLPQHHVSILE